MYGPTDPRWLENVVEVSPVLREPLELGSRVARRQQAEALIRALGLAEKASFGKPPTDSTYRLFVGMLDGLAAVCDADRVIPTEASQRIAAGEGSDSYAGVTRIAAAQAMLDLRWAGMEIGAGPVNEVLSQIRSVYISAMSQRIERMLRRWQKRGWVSDG